MSDKDNNLELPFAEPSKDDPKVDDRKLTRMVRAFMKKSDDYRKEHLELADRCRDRYQNWVLEERSKIRRANLKPSYGFTIIETVTPQLCQVFFGDEHVVKFEGREQDDFVFEEALTDFTDMQLADMDIELKFISFSKNAEIDGTAIMKVPYRYKEQEVTKRVPYQDPETGQMLRIKTTENQVMYDGPDAENIKLEDFFPDWSIKEPGNIKKMRGCVHRMFKSFAEIKRQKGVYKNIDELELSYNTKGERAWIAPYWSDNVSSRDSDRNGDPRKIKDSDKLELWEYWGQADLGKGELEEAIITIANGDVVIRAVPNFYDTKIKPFVASVCYIRPNEFYGIPELAAVDSEIREATAIRNARLDQINIGVNQMWLVDRAAGIDTKNLYSRPGGIIYSNDINGLKPMSAGDPSVSSGQELANIENNIAQATAIGSAPIVGATKSFGRSATGVNYLEQFSGSRTGLKAKIHALLFWQPLVEIMQLTNQQFVSESQWVRATNPDSPNPFNELLPDAFYRNFDYNIKTKLDLPDEVEAQKLQAASQLIQVMEATQPGVFKMDIVGEATLRSLIGHNAKRFMRTPQELQQLKMENAVMRVQEQQANAQIGAAAPQPNAAPANFNPVG